MNWCFIGVAFLLSLLTAAAAPTIIPLPKQVTVTGGSFLLCSQPSVSGVPEPASVAIIADVSCQETARQLATTFSRSTGLRFEIRARTNEIVAPGHILLTTSGTSTNLGSEGYELNVSTNSVVIRGSTATGVFYGSQSFLQLLPPQIFARSPQTNVLWQAPCVTIQDQPRFSYRGWMLDVTRHFFTKDEVKHYIDAMALHKLNYFHMHLVDDQGWRVEIKKYPLLTQVGAWRDGINWSLNPRSSTAYDGSGKYGGFYTQEDVREIVAYAEARHITVVPEIEMPGHSTAAASAYPQLFCNTNSIYDTDTDRNGPGVFCIAKPETMPFLQDVLTEVLEMFPGKYIHIGGDEVNFSLSWQGHSLDTNKMAQLGMSGNYQKYQGWFTQQIANWLNDRGRRMIGWSEIQNGGVLSNAVCMDWLSQAVRTATNGWPVIMSPSSLCYLNRPEYASGTWSIEPRGQPGAVTGLITVYSFEPIPASLPAQYATNIIGAQGNLWSEYVPSFLNIGLRAYPRLSAIAELTWTPAAQKNYSDFTNRLATHRLRLDYMQVNHNRGVANEVGTWTPSQTPGPAAFGNIDWNVTTNLSKSGGVNVSFLFTSGSNGLDIESVSLLENGTELDRDTHPGIAGTTNALYVLELPAYKRTANYVIRASVKGIGGTNSNGKVYLPNWN